MRLFTIAIASLLLAACASQPLYRPAAGPGNPGYSETQLTDDRFRVSFVGHSNTSAEQVENYALLRAAELTMNRGYDWFEVIDRNNRDKIREEQPRIIVGVGAGCGTFGCRAHESAWYSGVHLNSQRNRDHYETSMEIRLGQGKPENPNQVYDARELAKYLGEGVLNTAPDPALEDINGDENPSGGNHSED